MDDRDYCAAQVRDFDSDRYVTALFAPASRRADLLALYAFNLELARSRESVSEPALGHIRLQWWRDVITECYEGRARRHQVVQPLAAAIERHELPKALFDRIIDAREADFDPAPPETFRKLIHYAADTSGAVNLLALRVLGVRDEVMEQDAEAIGAVWALAGIARGLRHLLLTGRQPLPRDVMERQGLSQAELQSLRPGDALREAVRELAKMSTVMLKDVQTARAGVAGPVFLQAVLVRAYLKRLAATGYDPFDERNLHPLSYRALRLMIPALTGRV